MKEAEGNDTLQLLSNLESHCTKIIEASCRLTIKCPGEAEFKGLVLFDLLNHST